MRRRIHLIVAMVAGLTLLAARDATSACPGDCNSDGMISAGELTRAIALIIFCPSCPGGAGGIAAGCAAVPMGCSAADRNGNGCISAGELTFIISLINQGGCPATPTPTPTIPTPTPSVFAPPEAGPVAGSSAVIANLTTVVGGVVTAIITGLTNGGGDGSCPLGGFVMNTTNGTTKSIVFSDCEVMTPSGSVTFLSGSTAMLQLSNFSIDVSAVFRDSHEQELLIAGAQLTGTVTLTSAQSCLIATANMNVSNGTVQATYSSGTQSATLQGTQIKVDNVTYNDSTNCVPVDYRLTFTGPTTLNVPDSLSLDLVLSGFQAAVTNSTHVALTGPMTVCGSQAQISTPQAIDVTIGTDCPAAGTVAASLPSGMPKATYTNAKVGIDYNADNTTDATFPTCLAPPLFHCP